MLKNGLILGALILLSAPSMAAGRNDIHASATDVQPLLPGMMAPAFEVRDVHGAPFTFDPEVVDQPIVLTFYRGGWCPYCNLYLSELRHAEEDLKALGFQVWFISIDQPGVLRESLDEPDIGYTLYSDSKLNATRAFGIAFSLDEELVERYRDYDVDLEAASGETHHVLPVPSTFLIGTDGRINFAYSNPNYHVRLHPDVLLAAARAYRQEADRRLELRYKARKSGD